MVDSNFNKTVAVVQCRMGSTRLPGKTLRQFANGMSMLDVLMARLKMCKSLDEIVIAYPLGEDNDVLNRVVFYAGLRHFRGSIEDVLDRFYRAAVVTRAGIVVRVCGDNPLTDPAVIDRCVQTFANLNVDYLVPEGLPLGTFPELMTIDALDRAWTESTDPYDREHVTSYINSRPQDFKIHKLQWEPAQWQFPKVTVDTENDFQLVNTIVSRFKDPTELTLDHLKKR